MINTFLIKLLEKKEYIFNDDIIISNDQFEKMDKENLLKYYSSIKEKIHQIETFNNLKKE